MSHRSPGRSASASAITPALTSAFTPTPAPASKFTGNSAGPSTAAHASTRAAPGLRHTARTASTFMHDAIVGSWHRCRSAGLDTETRPDPSLLTHGELSIRQEAAGDMLRSARPLLQSLYAQVATAGQVAVLCDAEGMILASLGNAAFLRDAERLALRPGACWSEVARGTNAIGTGIATGAAVRVHGNEHFIRRHHRLSCSAAPFHYADGSLAGLIDVSGPPERAPDDLLNRVCETSAIIEQQLFLAAWPNAHIIALHADPARLGMPDAQLLAVDRDGVILGISQLREAQSPLAAQALAQWCQDGLGRLVDSLQRGRSPQRLAEARVHAQLLRPAIERGAYGQHASTSGSGAWGVAGRTSEVRTSEAQTADPQGSNQRSGGGSDWLNNPSSSARGLDQQDTTAQPASSTAHSADEAARSSTAISPALPSSQATSPTPLPGLSQRLLDTAQRLLAADIPVLLHGETGTGKDVLAHWLHDHGPLAARPFVAINCAAIPESLIEAELFGYEEGAFTGARRKGMPGRLVEADGGILFLDEIGDMPLAMQTRLLRVLQDRVVQPLGGGRPRQANFRLICATHRDLPALVAAGSFREDLFYRINHYPLTLPPLRERPGLADIIDAVARRHHAHERNILLSPPLRQAFLHYAWPGNLRQLDNLVATLLALCDDGGTIHIEDLPVALFAEMRGGAMAPLVYEEESGKIGEETGSQTAANTTKPTRGKSLGAMRSDQTTSTAAQSDDREPDCDDLIRQHGGASAAARAMGLSRSTFYRRLRAQRAENNPSSGH
ncbi:sigma-54-dependent Fis family transcriptional regulator [Pigmentiphaga aceris]|nr:sigma-54-dependent Fis family transcriptional regulator [Pigmentiphaga aceris]